MSFLYLIYKKRHSLYNDQGQIDHMIPVASAEEMQSLGHYFFSNTRKDMNDGHFWLSVAYPN